MERDRRFRSGNAAGSNFNSHAHVERDVAYLPIEKRYIISTHTLTWSVTIELEKLKNPESISTHTLTWSVTSACSAVDIAILYFNSHAHVERDEKMFGVSSELPYFNSHAHVERDMFSRMLIHSLMIFQLTRSRGAWLSTINFYRSASDFNSHAHVERDYSPKPLYTAWRISTHTLTWSVTHSLAPITLQAPISTHTLTWSVT